MARNFELRLFFYKRGGDLAPKDAAVPALLPLVPIVLLLRLQTLATHVPALERLPRFRVQGSSFRVKGLGFRV